VCLAVWLTAASDFPNLERFRQTLELLDFDKFPKSDLRMIAEMDNVLAVDIPDLLKRFPMEPAAAAMAMASAMGNPFAETTPFASAQLGLTWVITDVDREKYARQFVELQPVGGRLSGAALRPFLTQSKLSQSDLMRIWTLADMDRDAHLSFDEFTVAMYLVHARLCGAEIPQQLPESLLQSLARPQGPPPQAPPAPSPLTPGMPYPYAAQQVRRRRRRVPPLTRPATAAAARRPGPAAAAALQAAVPYRAAAAAAVAVAAGRAGTDRGLPCRTARARVPDVPAPAAAAAATAAVRPATAAAATATASTAAVPAAATATATATATAATAAERVPCAAAHGIPATGRGGAGHGVQPVCGWQRARRQPVPGLAPVAAGQPVPAGPGLRCGGGGGVCSGGCVCVCDAAVRRRTRHGAAGVTRRPPGRGVNVLWSGMPGPVCPLHQQNISVQLLSVCVGQTSIDAA
jgi:hypothetical protein